MVKLENEIFISEIVFKIVHGRLYKGFQDIPLLPVPITPHLNVFGYKTCGNWSWRKNYYEDLVTHF